MPHREPPVESGSSPAHDPLATFVPWLELREVLRHTLQIEADVSSALGWPRAIGDGVAARWFSGPQVLCTFSHAGDEEQPLAHLALPVDQAVALVDLCLGGPGRPSVACAAGSPSEAECGVLAYLAARCVRICAAPLRLRDVAARRSAELASWPDDHWLWPLRLKLGAQLELEPCLILAAAAPLAQQRVTARVALRDELEPGALAALRGGDLLLCEAWPGQFTHAGLSGCCELSVPALQASLPIALEAGQVRLLREASPAQRPGRARLVLGEVTASLIELAQLASGQRALPVSALERAQLELDGAIVASGKLVRYGGALALEVGDLASMR
jgi:hypothetical protein